MAYSLLLLASSDLASVYVLLKNSHNFLEDIKGINKRDFEKIIYYFDRFVENGTLHDEEKFKYLENNLFEFKTKNLRVLGFIAPDRPIKTIIVCSFHKKQKNKSPSKDLDKARNISSMILDLIKKNQIEFGE